MFLIGNEEEHWHQIWIFLLADTLSEYVFIVVRTLFKKCCSLLLCFKGPVLTRRRRARPAQNVGSRATHSRKPTSTVTSQNIIHFSKFVLITALFTCVLNLLALCTNTTWSQPIFFPFHSSHPHSCNHTWHVVGIKSCFFCLWKRIN